MKVIDQERMKAIARVIDENRSNTFATSASISTAYDQHHREAVAAMSSQEKRRLSCRGSQTYAAIVMTEPVVIARAIVGLLCQASKWTKKYQDAEIGDPHHLTMASNDVRRACIMLGFYNITMAEQDTHPTLQITETGDELVFDPEVDEPIDTLTEFIQLAIKETWK